MSRLKNLFVKYLHICKVEYTLLRTACQDFFNISSRYAMLFTKSFCSQIFFSSTEEYLARNSSKEPSSRAARIRPISSL